MPTSEDIALVQRVLDGVEGANVGLTRRITPAIQAEISHLLLRMAPTQGRSARQELDDLVQETFVALFDRGLKRLRDWDPSRGCTLETYVRMVARSRALDILRSRRRSPWQGEETALDDAEGPGDDRPDHETVVLARESLVVLEKRLHELLGPRDYSMFLGLFVEGMLPADVAAALGMTPAAVYQWSSRFRRHTLPNLLRAVLGAPEPA